MKKVSQQSKIKYIQLHANRLDVDKVYEHIVKDREMKIFERDVFKPVWYKEEGYRIDLDSTNSPIYTIMRQLGWDAPTALIHKVLREFVAQNLVTASHRGNWSIRQLYYLLTHTDRAVWRYKGYTKDNIIHTGGSYTAWRTGRDLTDLCFALGIIDAEKAEWYNSSEALHPFEMAFRQSTAFEGFNNLRMKFFKTKDDIQLSIVGSEVSHNDTLLCNFLDKVGGVYNNNTVFRLPSFVVGDADADTLSNERYYKSRYFNR